MSRNRFAPALIFTGVPFDPKHLPEDPKLLQQMVLDLMTQLDREAGERAKVESLLRELLDAKRNRKSEQLSSDQLALFASLWQARQAQRARAQAEPSEEPKDDDNAPGAAASDSNPHGGGRQPLARHLKRERIVHDLAQADRHCSACDQDLRLIGEESSERYEYVPAQLTVIEDICKKYACQCTVKTATKPPHPIEKSTAGASLLAQVIVAQDRRSPTAASATDDLCAARSGDLATDHVRLAGAMCRVAEAVVRNRSGNPVPIESDRNRRHRGESIGCKTAVRAPDGSGRTMAIGIIR